MGFELSDELCFELYAGLIACIVVLVFCFMVGVFASMANQLIFKRPESRFWGGVFLGSVVALVLLVALWQLGVMFWLIGLISLPVAFLVIWLLGDRIAKK